MRIVPRVLLATALPIALGIGAQTPTRAAETLVYDVTSVDFGIQTVPLLSSTTERIQITDRGPQTDGSPRWTTDSLAQVAIWAATGGGASDTVLFGNDCGALSMVAPFGTVPRRVQVSSAAGGGDFAWLPGTRPTGETDPYAFFCLKWSHQSTPAWAEHLSIGKRVYASPVKV